MRTSLILTMTGGFIAAVALSTPAGATKISQAIQLCKKNPNCHDIGGGQFCVDVGTDLCKHLVTCPKKGNCKIAYLKAGAGQKPPGNVGTALARASGKPSGIKAPTATTAQGGTPKVVRDHRTDPIVRDHRDHRSRAEGRPHR